MCALDSSSGIVELEALINVFILQEEGNSGAIRIKAPPSLSYSALLNFSLKTHGLNEIEKWTLMDCTGDHQRNYGDVAASLGDATLARIGIQVRPFCFKTVVFVFKEWCRYGRMSKVGSFAWVLVFNKAI